MKWRALLRCIVLLFTAIFLFACGSSGGSSGDGSSGGGDTGTVSVGLTDNSTDKYKAVYVTIKELQFNRRDPSTDQEDKSWETFETPNKTYNLLRLVNGVSETLGEKEFPAGYYKQIRMIIGETPESEFNNQGNPHPHANYVILQDGTPVPLKIPSGLKTGIKLVHNFVVKDGETVELLLDFDACRSVVKAGKSGKYILKPVIKVIDTIDKSVVFGGVTDESNGDPINGANVSAQISDGLSASAARSTLTDNGDNFEDEKVNYELILSPTQSYTVVVFKDEIFTGSFKGEIITGSKMYDTACAKVDAPWEDDPRRDFALEINDSRTISGEVTVIPDNEDPDFTVYVSIYTDLYTAESEFCGYAEVTTLPVSPDPEDGGRITYFVQLPLGNYDVVASAECFIPDMGDADLNAPGIDRIVNLTIEQQDSCD
jgi:hypothetical protein